MIGTPAYMNGRPLWIGRRTFIIDLGCNPVARGRMSTAFGNDFCKENNHASTKQATRRFRPLLINLGCTLMHTDYNKNNLSLSSVSIRVHLWLCSRLRLVAQERLRLSLDSGTPPILPRISAFCAPVERRSSHGLVALRS